MTAFMREAGGVERLECCLHAVCHCAVGVAGDFLQALPSFFFPGMSFFIRLPQGSGKRNGRHGLFLQQLILGM